MNGPKEPPAVVSSTNRSAFGVTVASSRCLIFGSTGSLRLTLAVILISVTDQYGGIISVIFPERTSFGGCSCPNTKLAAKSRSDAMAGHCNSFLLN